MSVFSMAGIAILFYALAFSNPLFASAGRSSMNIPSYDKRMEGIESWFVGFMGGRTDMLLKHPAVLGTSRRGDVLFNTAWLFQAAYPGTVYGWSGAIVTQVEPKGVETLVTVTKPETPKFGVALPRCVEEWAFIPDPSKTRPISVERVLRMTPDGILDMPEEAFRIFVDSIRRDVEEGLRWIESNPSKARGMGELARHILGVDAENSVSSTVKLPNDLGDAWKRAAEKLRGAK